MVAYWLWGEHYSVCCCHFSMTSKVSTIATGHFFYESFFFSLGWDRHKGKKYTSYISYKCLHVKFFFLGNICILSALVKINLIVLPAVFILLFCVSKYLSIILALHRYVPNFSYLWSCFWKRLEERVSINFEFVINHLYWIYNYFIF